LFLIILLYFFLFYNLFVSLFVCKIFVFSFWVVHRFNSTRLLFEASHWINLWNLVCWIVAGLEHQPNRGYQVPCSVIKRTSDRLACRSTIGRITVTAVCIVAIWPVLVISYSFLDTNCATKLPLEIGIILELPLPLEWSRDCLCIDVYGSESSASTNGPATRTGFRGLPRSSTARISAKRFVFNALQQPRSRLATEKEANKKTCRAPQCNFGQRTKQETA